MTSHWAKANIDFAFCFPPDKYGGTSKSGSNSKDTLNPTVVCHLILPNFITYKNLMIDKN